MHENHVSTFAPGTGNNRPIRLVPGRSGNLHVAAPPSRTVNHLPGPCYNAPLGLKFKCSYPNKWLKLNQLYKHRGTTARRQATY